MRASLIAVAGLLFAAATCLTAAELSPDEKKLQAEFQKAYRVNDKDARKSALVMMEGTKHPSSWSMVANVAATDPELDVRVAAVTILAKVPAHDTSIARQLAGLYSNLKANDFQGRLDYAKAMAAIEFKADVVYAIGEHLSKLRYPDIPPLLQTSGAAGSGDNRRQIEAAKKARKEFEELLEAWNAISKSELTSPTKDTPQLMKTWLTTGVAKLAQADRELADKYKKEDAEAAKAAKAANSANNSKKVN
jgi:hypothetical protein